MNSRIKHLLANANQVSIKDKELVEKEIAHAPFFHPLRFLLLNTIADKKSEAYKNALALASLYAPNREVLLDFTLKSYPKLGTGNIPPTKGKEEVMGKHKEATVIEDKNKIAVKKDIKTEAVDTIPLKTKKKTTS